MKERSAPLFPWQTFASELIGTALLVPVGLSLVILMFGTGGPIIRVVPSDGVRRLITGFLFRKLRPFTQAIILDARAIHRILGETRNEKASRAGAIPGSINLPLGALIMDNGALKPPAELLWMLRTRGITPDRTVITTCDTGLAATDAFFILRYLGFPDVRVHDEAWVGWSRSR